jgi:hypothetical protein
VETGASRREAAERYGISPSVVVIWGSVQILSHIAQATAPVCMTCGW